MSFSDLPEHLQMPALRGLQPIPIKKGDTPLVLLRDVFALSEETVAIPPQIFALVQHIDGSKTAEEIATATNAPPEQFIELLQKLDSVGLLWGPTSKKLEEDKLSDLRSIGYFPAKASATLGEDSDSCKVAIQKWFDETEDPEIEESVTGIVAPHLDYNRGWPNYASAYYVWQNAEAPDRVVILGTNHFGNGDGVVLSTLGFDTPIGTVSIDQKVVQSLETKLGSGVSVDVLDHSAEHSIELHLPWIQYCFGDVPIVAALIPSPMVEMIEDDGERTTTDEFVTALRDTLSEVGGTTYFVSSADLSHVGPQFGEPRPVDDQRKFDVERHDREMMAKFMENDADGFIEAMKWNNNATRWCSIGNMSAVLNLANPSEIELIDYRQACDDRGAVLVSSCAMMLS